VAQASDGHLQLLFCCAHEVEMLLLAAHRLRQLSPELASEGSIEGAVVGCLNWDGSVALRSVVAVKQLDTTRDGEFEAFGSAVLVVHSDMPKKRVDCQLAPKHVRQTGVNNAAKQPAQFLGAALHPTSLGSGSIDREATLLRLWPGEPVPVPLSRLLSQSGLAAAAPMVWSAALTAFRQAEKLYHAGGGGSSSAVVGDYGGGAHLGDRASCVLVALRLAKLALLQQPLAELSALMQQVGVSLGEAVALLRADPGSKSEGAVVTQASRAAALPLLHAVTAVRCQPPDPVALQALLQQLQDLEQTELAPQTQAWCNPPGWEGQLRNLEGAKQHQKQQEQQEDQQEGQQDEEQPDEEEQQQQQQQQDFGEVAELQHTCPTPAATCCPGDVPPTQQTCIKKRARMFHPADTSAEQLQRHERCSSMQGAKRQSPSPQAPRPAASDMILEEEGSADARLPCSPNMRPNTTRSGRGDGAGGGNSSDDGGAGLVMDGARAVSAHCTVHCWAHASTRHWECLVPEEVRLCDHFPPEVTSDASRRDLSELLVSLATMCAVSGDRWQETLLSNQFSSMHTYWTRSGQQVPIALSVLWGTLPPAVQGYVQQAASAAAAAACSESSTHVASSGAVAGVSALAAFIAHHCTAVRMVPGIMPAAAALAVGWRAALLSHDLLRWEAAWLEGRVLREVKAEGMVPVSAVGRLLSASMHLYSQVRSMGDRHAFGWLQPPCCCCDAAGCAQHA
jgi:hypothetical protein